VIGIQVVSHARKHGVLLKPNQLFEHQTVAELAAVAASAGSASTSASESASDAAPAPAPHPAEAAVDDLDAVLHALAD
jgi:predicted flap endonuclease-1-like 5' DNA nuclease